MAATINVMVAIQALDLDDNPDFISNNSDGTAPDTYVKHYPTLATADTEEALDVGDVATVQLLVIKAIDYDLDVDLDFVAAFDADLTVKAGEAAAVIPYPAGTVYVKNNGAGETPKYKYLLLGTT